MFIGTVTVVVQSFNAPADVRLFTGLPVYAYQRLPSEKATDTIIPQSTDEQLKIF